MDNPWIKCLLPQFVQWVEQPYLPIVWLGVQISDHAIGRRTKLLHFAKCWTNIQKNRLDLQLLLMNACIKGYFLIRVFTAEATNC